MSTRRNELLSNLTSLNIQFLCKFENCMTCTYAVIKLLGGIRNLLHIFCVSFSLL